MESTTPPSADSGRRLDAVLKRAIRLQVASESETAPVFTHRARAIALEHGVSLTLEETEKLLSSFGYRPTDTLQPYTRAEGGMGTSRIWTLAAPARALSPQQRAIQVAARLTALTEAFMADVFEDSALDGLPLSDRAAEATRIFATSLSAQVKSRTKTGGASILPNCGDVANSTFRGAAGGR